MSLSSTRPIFIACQSCGADIRITKPDVHSCLRCGARHCYCGVCLESRAEQKGWRARSTRGQWYGH